MKIILAFSFGLLLCSVSFANTSSELAKVRALADHKIAGLDVKKEISVYENTDNNPCAATGTSYIVKVSVRKSVMKQMPNGDVGQVREWQDFNEYYISREDLLRGEDLSDTLCQE